MKGEVKSRGRSALPRIFRGADWTDRVVLVSEHSEASHLSNINNNNSLIALILPTSLYRFFRIESCNSIPAVTTQRTDHTDPRTPNTPCVGKAPGLKFSSLLGLLASHSLPSPGSFSLSLETRTTAASYLSLSCIAGSDRESSSRFADLACFLQPQHCGDRMHWRYQAFCSYRPIASSALLIIRNSGRGVSSCSGCQDARWVHSDFISRSDTAIRDHELLHGITSAPLLHCCDSHIQHEAWHSLGMMLVTRVK